MKNVASIVAVVFVLIAYYAGGFFSPKTIIIYENDEYVKYLPYTESGNGSASVIVPAVDQNGNGVPTYLIVQTMPGSGKILVSIDKLIFWADTQDSIRIARDVAQKYTNHNISSFDIIYTIKANASVIEGPSAGAALAVATIAALEGKQPNISVMITGTINPDGSIGKIGEALAKSKAAKQIGAQLFIVPAGQSVETKFVPKKSCSTFGSNEVCRVENAPQTVNIEEEVGIAVVEASNIGEVVRYFMGEI